MNTQKIITLQNQTIKLFYSKLNIKNILAGGILVSFETNDKILKYSSELGFSDIKYPFAFGEENIYFMLFWKNIPIHEYET